MFEFKRIFILSTNERAVNTINQKMQESSASENPKSDNKRLYLGIGGLILFLIISNVTPVGFFLGLLTTFGVQFFLLWRYFGQKAAIVDGNVKVEFGTPFSLQLTISYHLISKS